MKQWKIFRAFVTIFLGAYFLPLTNSKVSGAILEFDHAKLVVRRPEKGFVGAANSYFTLYQEAWGDADPYWGRIGAARVFRQSGC